jgi:hypothetical protein
MLRNGAAADERGSDFLSRVKPEKMEVIKHQQANPPAYDSRTVKFCWRVSCACNKLLHAAFIIRFDLQK